MNQRLLYLIVFLEGYAVLSSELLMIRLLTPHVGSTADITSIIIGAVLLSLSYGYYKGGQLIGPKQKQSQKIRGRLAFNFFISLIILGIGLSYIFLELFFGVLAMAKIPLLLQTSLYCLVFCIYPIYLLGQTLPLIANYFSKLSTSQAAGYLMAASTIGSFLGSIFSTLALMNTIGVHYTALVTMGIIFILFLIVYEDKKQILTITATCFLLLMTFFNSGAVLEKMGVVNNNVYHTAIVKDLPQNQGRMLLLDKSYSAIITDNPENEFPYKKFMVDSKLFDHPSKKLDVLVIGAGGFSIGHQDKKNNYTYVDIDKDLKNITEEHLLGAKLAKNQKFIHEDARPFLKTNTHLYDVIVLDAFQGKNKIPPQLITQEFFQLVKNALNKDGIVVGNFITRVDSSDKFSINLNATWQSIFPDSSRQITNPISLWDESAVTNVLYIYRHHQGMTAKPYTDNLNRFYLDFNTKP